MPPSCVKGIKVATLNKFTRQSSLLQSSPWLNCNQKSLLRGYCVAEGPAGKTVKTAREQREAGEPKPCCGTGR